MTTIPSLVSTDWLSANLGERDLRVFDTTVWLTMNADGTPPTVTSGRDSFDEAHVPGAAFADLLALSDPDTQLPFMLPDAERFAAGMGALGVGPGTRVVAYDQAAGMWATRLWWMLRAFGFDDVGVLDGGLTAWRTAGLPISTDPPPHRPATFTPRPRPGLIASRADVEAAIGDGATCTINALPAPLYTGDAEMVPGRPGRIPGSASVPTATLIDPDTNRFVDAEQLREHFERADALERSKLITYCGGGIAATFDAFALSLLGRDDVAVYDGSIAEWASDPDAPLEVG